MDTVPAPSDAPQTEVSVEDRLAWEATAIADARADVAAGRLTDAAEVRAWVVGAMETAAEFFRLRAGDAQPNGLRAILARAPDRAPEPGDIATIEAAAREEETHR